MNLLEIDIQDYIPDIADAYTEVLGAEYKDIIEERLNNFIFMPYNTRDNMYFYLDKLKIFKKRELSIKFLEEIGIDVSKEKNKSYTDRLDTDVSDLAENYLGYLTFDDSSSGIKAFDKENEYCKIEFINFIRNRKNPLITKDNLEEFSKTAEYKEILNNVNKYIQIYEQLEKEYQAYLQELAPYQEYVDKEGERWKHLENDKINELYELLIEEKLISYETKSYLDENYSNTNDKARQLFGSDVLWGKFYVEYFSQKDEDILKDSSKDEFLKNMIYLCRLKYLENIGAIKNKLEYDFSECKEVYEKYVSQEDIKKYIPSAESAEEITIKRELLYEELHKDFIYGSPDFICSVSKVENNENNKKFIYEVIKNNQKCITRCNW